MNIPEQYHKMIIDELKDVEMLISNAHTIDDKLYYFTASFGIIYRVLNFHCDSLLIFAHQVLQLTHQTISQRLTLPGIPGNITNSMPNEFFNSLIDNLKDLRLSFEKNDDNKIRESLEKMSVLSYAATGNGFYLFLRKKLVI
jgi:hypothetical protein